MNRAAALVALAFATAFANACGAADDAEAAMRTESGARAARLERARTQLDTGNARTPIARWVLPRALNEISGLTLTPDARLLAHDDENGFVWELDYRRGTVVKRFALGAENVHADFEGIAMADGMIFMLESHGKVFVSREGNNGQRVKYGVHETGLGRLCEFEGITLEESTSALLAVCKNAYLKELSDSLVVFRIYLHQNRPARIERITAPLSAIVDRIGAKKMHPSDIAVDPLTGNYVIVSSQERAIVSITPAGEVVFARPLPPGHEHPEGIAITRDSLLIVSDEAGQHAATITLYRWP